MEHIVFLDRSNVRATLPEPTFEHRWTDYDLTSPEQIVDRCREASIVISHKVVLNGETLSRLPKLKMVAIPATGTDHVDLNWCADHGIHVANCPDYTVHSVPEHTLSMAMALRRNLLAYRKDLLNGEWQRSGNFCLFTHPVRDLHGATLAIVGRGSLGIETARLAEAFGMRVLFAEHKGATSVRPGYVAFEEALRVADVVSLHCPMSPQTRGLIGARELGLMKSDAVLVNTARGGLIDEAALLDALRHRRIAGAALDVLSEEPPRSGNPLLEIELPNLLITPHVAWISDSTMHLLAKILMDAIENHVRLSNDTANGEFDV